MNTEQTKQQSLHISQEKLLAFVRAMIGGSGAYPSDEDPLPPGPWDPIIRIALKRINIFGPRPEPWGPHPEPWKGFGWPVPWRTMEPEPIPWLVGFGNPVPWKLVFASILARHPEIFDIIGGGPGFGEDVALNPQPLPPRFAFLVSVAQAVTSRAELLQEIADATQREGEQQRIYTRQFSDDWCGNGFKLKWLPPRLVPSEPPPPRPNWFAEELSGIDLVVMATQFEQAAKEAFSPVLRQNLADASAKFAEAGVSRMQCG